MDLLATLPAVDVLPAQRVYVFRRRRAKEPLSAERCARSSRAVGSHRQSKRAQRTTSTNENFDSDTDFSSSILIARDNSWIRLTPSNS
jgi:hypothetical protein